jgi:hypothetical protein
MREKFETVKFNSEKLAKIEAANLILAEYEAQGYDLTLRQLYYQFVARGFIENSERSYKSLGCIISDARLAGLMDWDMIKDRARECVIPPHWKSPKDILVAAAQAFRLNKWEDQPIAVEVMVEKQALEGVLEPVCRELDISFTANKGYSSSSAMYEAGKRIARRAMDYARAHGKHGGCIVLYLGDHDPSGIDMARDVEERLKMFSEMDTTLSTIRLALNMDQVREYNPPENPAKVTDSRASSYIKRFGEHSWELDALPPEALANLVRDAVADVRDQELWDAAVEREEKMRAALEHMAEEYEEEE